MAPWPWRLITVDIDGTLTTRHGWQCIAEARGRLDAFRRTNRRLLAGRENEDDHLERLFELAVGLRRSEFELLLGAIPKVKGIRETVQAIHERGAVAGLLSHNPPMVLDWYCRSFGFDAGAGGRGLTFRKDRVALPRDVRADKVGGVAELAERFRVPLSGVCHVGDAWPDARLAPILGGFVAFNPKTRRVADVADAVVRGHDLGRVIPVLDGLRPRRVVNGARPFAEGSNTAGANARQGQDGVRRPAGPAPQVAQPPPPERGRRAAPVPSRGGPGP